MVLARATVRQEVGEEQLASWLGDVCHAGGRVGLQTHRQDVQSLMVWLLASACHSTSRLSGFAGKVERLGCVGRGLANSP